jgi:hypothetical protein
VTARRREPPELSVGSVLLPAAGAIAVGVLLSLSFTSTVSLAVGAVLGQLLFVIIVRRSN